jgi:antirestriction protein ArdC
MSAIRCGAGHFVQIVFRIGPDSGGQVISAELELATELLEENASYIPTWLEVLKNDTHFIFKAAVHAQHASDYLRTFSTADVTTTTSPDAKARAA